MTPNGRQERFEELERFVSEAEARIADFFTGLTAIHDEQLWQEGDYRSWNDYLLRRWGASKSTGWRWLQQGRKVLELEEPEQNRRSGGSTRATRRVGDHSDQRRPTESPASQVGVPSQRSLARAAKEARAT